MKAKQIVAAIAALAASGSLMAQTIATVNGVKIDSSEIETRVKLLQQQNQGMQDGPELRRYLQQEVVLEAVVTQEAKRLKLDQSKEYKDAESQGLKEAKAAGDDKRPEFKQRWALFQKGLLVQAFGVDVLKKQPVSEAEVKQAYDAFAKHYQGSDEVQLGEIVTDKDEQAQAALKDLAAKKSFADVAKQYTIDPQGKAAGGIYSSFAPLADLKLNNPELHKVISALNKGEYTKTPLKDGNVNVIFYVHDKRKVSVPALADVQDNIYADLADARVQTKVAELLQKAKIELPK